MAKFDLKFIDFVNDNDWISTKEENGKISITSKTYNHVSVIELDKSTAIKFAKTLRTEINKITEMEVRNER